MSAKYAAPAAPPPAKPLTSKTHGDVYPAISATGELPGSANNLNVLITGAGRGVGRATAIAFAQAGAKKVVLTSRGQGQLDEVEQAIEAMLGKGKVQVVKVAGDISVQADVERLFDQSGDVDVLINNAGVLEHTLPIHESDPEEWWRTHEVNTKGTYLPTREFLRRNLGRPLTVINTSSIGSMATSPGVSAYQPAKTLINRFTEFLHYEYQSQNVRTFAYHPGSVLTGLAKSMPSSNHQFLTDTPELAAGFLLWLATQGDKVDFLRGRYVSANWDVDELLVKKDEIVNKGLLWTRVVGQEQGLEAIQLPWIKDITIGGPPVGILAKCVH